MLKDGEYEDEFSPELFRAGFPLGTFDRLRLRRPVFGTYLPDGTRVWNLLRYDDVVKVLTSSQHYNVPQSTVHVEPQAELDLNGEPWSLRAAMALNPPDHGTHKQKLVPMMKAEFVETFRPFVRGIAEELAQCVKDKGEVDAIEDFAAPAATAIACEYLGIDPANRDYARRLSAEFMGDGLPPQTLGSYRDLILGPRSLNTVHGSPMRAATELVHESMAKAPWLDEAFCKHAGRWEVEELCLQTLTAGIAGLRNCIAAAVLCLAPQWANAKSELAVWQRGRASVADEVIRHASPLLRVRRILATDAVWHETEMQQGDVLFAWLVSANFDPARFNEPHAFHPFRTPNPHLSFSGGMHRCLGAPLAKMELEEIISAMLKMWSTIELRATPVRFPSNVVNEYLQMLIHVA